MREGEEGEGGQGQISSVSDDVAVEHEKRGWWRREGECGESSQLALDPKKKIITPS